MDHLDFWPNCQEEPILTQSSCESNFQGQSKDMNYLKEMKTRADGEGVTSKYLIIAMAKGNAWSSHFGGQKKQ